MAKIFSIVTPNYNQGRFIAEAIEAVLMQAGDFYIDYVIMDAASKDESVSVIKRYEQQLKENCTLKTIDGHDFYIKKDKEFKLNNCLGISFRWHSAKDKGQADAVNKGIKQAFGDIFSFLNADDVLERNAFAYIAEEFEHAPDVAVVYGNAFYIDAAGKVTGLYPPSPKIIDLPITCVISQPSAFTRMDVVREVGGFNAKVRNSLDYEFWLKLYHKNYTFRHIREVLSATRMHEDTKTKRNQAEIPLESFAMVKEYHKSIPRAALEAYTLYNTVFGKVGRFVLRAGNKLLRGVIRLVAPICYLLVKGKVEQKRKYLFGSETV